MCEICKMCKERYDMSNEVLELSFEYSVLSVKFVRDMKKTTCEFELMSQFLRSATSVGANITEAQFPQSKADFVSKMSIARKEANESKYWLRLLVATEIVAKEQVDELLQKIERILKLLNAIIISSRK